MATISNTPRPGYVWDSTDNVWYPIGVGGHSHPDYITQATAVNPTIIDAKGDIITATAADTPARLAVGNNGETLVADSSTTTGLRYQGLMAAGKNAIINGGFDIWQRGTSVSVSASQSNIYTADRWSMGTNTNQACTVSRQATGDTTNLPNIQYCARVQRNSGQTGTGLIPFTQALETTNSIPFNNKIITLSFYARAGANYSASSNVLNVQLYSGTGTDQNLWAYTGGILLLNASPTLTTTWQKFSYPLTVGSAINELGFQFNYTPTGTAGAADYYEITGVQLELGSVATAFARNAGTIQGELAACQRYYEVGSSVDGWSGYAVNANTYYLSIPFKVQKRTSSPTMTTTISQNIGSASVISQSEYGFRSSGVASATVNSAYFIFSAWNASAEL